MSARSSARVRAVSEKSAGECWGECWGKSAGKECWGPINDDPFRTSLFLIAQVANLIRADKHNYVRHP